MLALLIPVAQPQATALQGLFTDNMVLQRDKKVPVWGTAAPGQKVTVTLAGQTDSTITSSHGNWVVTFKPIHNPGPYTLAVTGDHRFEIHNVAVGEVWICSGQSNMEFTTAGAQNAATELQFADFPNIRLYHVDKRTVDLPLRDAHNVWEVCSGSTVRNFSAVGYFFARTVYQTLHVPIGLIEADWGGTPAESWTTRSALVADPKLHKLVDDYEAARPTLEAAMQKYQRDLAAYNAKTFLADTGNDGVKNGWAEPEFDDSTWKDAPVPGEWNQALKLNLLGGAWYRKTVMLPAGWAGKDVTLALGAIDDFDTTYFNGRQVGATGSETPNSWQVQREYKIPGRLVVAGKNVIAVRVWNQAGPGGMMGGEPIQLTSAAGDTLPLQGAWRFSIEKGIQPDSSLRQPTMPMGPGNPWVPASLYNGMIACLPPFAIRGVIWYQGESNADRAHQYRRLFPLLIRSWRAEFNQGDFPFYFVQLAAFQARNLEPVESQWAELREAQDMTLRLPNTGMATAIDIGDANDIHPKNKQEVGRRLALIALRKNYGQTNEFSGPRLRTFTVQPNGEVRLEFTHTAGGLVDRDGHLAGFALAGADRKFHWAIGRIDRNVVILSCQEVLKPVAVRYGWADNPPLSLYNQAGLPAPPFRTDDWPAR
ncbi:MAG: sialate O-acetylesterase [Fimbriimonadaceae bacterium]